MAISLSSIRARVRSELRDTDGKNNSFDQIEYDQHIAGAYIELAARIPPPSLYTESAFTISAGGDTFTLPETVTEWTGNDGGAEYNGDIRIRLRSTGQMLYKVSVEEIDALRDGDVSVVTAVPRQFALWEDNSQAVQGRCYPGAASAEACDLWASLTVDDLRDYVGSGGTSTMDDVEVLFSRMGAQALVLYTASAMLLKMSDDDAALRRLDKSAASDLRSRADVLLYQEEARKHAIEETGRIGRWVP
jgi:hypothetical protein